METSRHISRRAAIVGGALTFAFAGALKASDLKPGEIDTVGSVPTGDTLTLKSGLRVKMAGITAPKLDAPWGPQAQAGLNGLLAGRSVRLSYGGDPRDRYERALAQVHSLSATGVEDLWLQGEMVRLGLARVYTWPDEYVDHAALYALERDARAVGRGLWGHTDYAVRSPDPNPLAQHVDSLQIIEGIVTSTADVRGRVYLNFGADYKTDFTIAVAKKHRKRFAETDLLGLEGARVRVRGWVELINGPMVWTNHPARIEVLS